MELANRMTLNPTLRQHDWTAAMASIKRKKKDVANVLRITPETLSRILAGKPASGPVEKLFRLFVICELLPDESVDDTIAKHCALLSVISLRLSPMELLP